MNSRKREIGYDVVRVVAMLFVIAVHTNPKPYENGSLWQELFLAVFFSCNGLFFMLSGRFALATELDGVKSILQFYKRKFFTLFIPLIVFGALSYWAGLYKGTEPYTFGSFLKGTVKGLLGEWNGGYLWFMFALIGLTISAPFLGKMVRAMRNGELHLMAAIGLIWEILSVFLGKNAGLGFGYSGWIMTGWAFYYFLGYYVYRLFEKSSRKRILMIAGLAAFILNSLWTWKMPEYSFNAHDLSPLYTVFIVGLYLFLQSAKIDPLRTFGKVITWVAAQSYFVYLLHHIIQILWLNHAEWFSGKLANYLAHFAVCTVISVLIAFLLNLPYQRLCRKVLKDPHA